MNEALHTQLAQDLAVVRALAEEGRRAPLLGGSIYVVFGLAVALCLVANWAIGTRLVAVSYWAIPAIWLGGMSLASIAARIIRMRLVRRPGAVGIGNAVTAAVWSASGAFLGIFAAALFAALLAAPEDVFGFSRDGGAVFAIAFSIFQPVSFGVYAVALAASAEAAKSDLLKTFSRIAFAAMAATAALIGRHEQLLVGAAAALLVLAVPGVLLMRRERAN